MSLTSVEKKQNIPDHPGAESDSDNDDDNEDKNNINTKENEQNTIGPSEMDLDELPELNTVNNILEKDEVMEEN